MAQHDYVIANGTGAAVRSDLNNGLSAIVTQNSGATEPATTYAFMRWADTTAGVMKMRNSANNAWITLYQLDGEWTNIAFENGTAAAPSIYFKDSGTDTGFYSPGANQVGISTGGTARLTIDSNGNVDIDSNTLYVDATNNRVGLGTSTPQRLLTTQIGSNGAGLLLFRSSETNNDYGGLEFGNHPSDITNYRKGAIYYVSDGSGFGRGAIYICNDGAGDSNNVQPSDAKMVIDSSGRVGIGTTSPSTNLDVRGATEASIRWGTTSNFYGTVFADATLTAINSYNSNPLAFSVSTGTSFSEKARIDTSGRLLIGTSTSASAGDAQYAKLQVQGNTTGALSGLVAIERGTTAASTANNDTIGAILFTDSAGGGFASITTQADSSPNPNDYPGRLVFSTTADGASSPTERVRITQTGYLKASNTGSYQDSGSAGNYHEIRTDAASQHMLYTACTSGSYGSTAFIINVNRAATSSFNFFCPQSSGGDNEFNLRGDGNAYADGSWNGGGADYAEFFEWSDGNPDEEDRRGISVVLDGNQIRPAVNGEDPIGVISGNPSVVGDAAWNKWSGKYLRDDYGTYILEDYEVVNDEGETVVQQRRKLNPAYDPDQEYVSREQRPEWDCVGLMGKLRIRKGQPTGSRWIKMRDISDSVEEWLVR